MGASHDMEPVFSGRKEAGRLFQSEMIMAASHYGLQHVFGSENLVYIPVSNIYKPCADNLKMNITVYTVQQHNGHDKDL